MKSTDTQRELDTTQPLDTLEQVELVELYISCTNNKAGSKHNICAYKINWVKQHPACVHKHKVGL